MSNRTILAAAALAFAIAASPLSAKNDKTPPGDPCGDGPGKGTGNPCNGNNGNDGGNGNAGKDDEGIDIVENPGETGISMPAVSGRSAYITQIGDSNVAAITQTAPNAYARIDQESDRNDALIKQHGTGSAYATVRQRGGNRNVALAYQDGPGQNVLHLAQDGASNNASAAQYAYGSSHNAARLVQTGENNQMALLQSGDGNVALLEQQGNGNLLNVAQDGNKQLTMVQSGSGLSFTINQEHPRLLITQTNPN